jgi:hypothetical protein
MLLLSLWGASMAARAEKQNANAVIHTTITNWDNVFINIGYNHFLINKV